MTGQQVLEKLQRMAPEQLKLKCEVEIYVKDINYTLNSVKYENDGYTQIIIFSTWEDLDDS